MGCALSTAIFPQLVKACRRCCCCTKAWVALPCGGIFRKLAAATGLPRHRLVAGRLWRLRSRTPSHAPPRYMHREAEESLPALLAALHIERPLLVGHSDGGSIALILPGHFRGSAGCCRDGAARVRRGSDPGRYSRWRSTWDRNRLAAEAGPLYHLDAPRVFSDWNDTWLSPPFRDWNIEEYLPKIRCPVLAIQGEDDEYATMRQIEVIAEKVPGTQLLKLPNCGHSPQRDQEAVVLAALVAFLSVNRAKGS
jgi:pimeloyl-ACP methyl ester carboxylesterase